MDQWYYAQNGGQQGPMALAELQRLLASGGIDAATLVWKDGMAQWTAAGSVAELIPQAPDGWHYAANGQQLGPVSLVNLQQMISTGQVMADTLVWHESMPAWAAAGTRAELFAAGPAYGNPGMLAYGQSYASYNNITFAGFWLRFVAYIIDSAVLFVPNLIIGVIIGLIMSGVGFTTRNGDNPLPQLVANLITFVLNWLYFAWMESSPKQATLGKMAISLKVTDLNGNRISFGHATGRYFGKIISGLICAVGFMMAGWTAKKQGLHDTVASTLVVRK